MKIVGQNLDVRNNCLNLFRLLSAIRVFFFHAVEHLDIIVPKYVDNIIGFFQGVSFFFIVSGFLIYFSIDRSKNYKEYAKKRFLRIYPELWLCVILELISIICLYNVSNVGYFIVFAITQSTVFQFYNPIILHGYGCGTPNGSLWTICVLIQFYVIAYPLKMFLKNKNVIKHLLIIIVALIFSALSFYLKDFLPKIVIKLYNQSLLEYLYLFIIGMFLAKYSNKILPILKKYYYIFILLFVGVYLIKLDIPNTAYGIIIPTTYFVAVLGFSYRFPKLNIKNDLSYQIYLYHMIVINIFITFELTGNILYMIIVFIITLILAKISQLTVGRLLLKKEKFNL